jgi:hypothetical protein
MVKNTVGGSKTKGFARKSFSKSSSTSSVRLPTHELETFAVVTKMFGGGLCQVITSQPSSLTLNCVIRNKFKARQKNMNLVSLHSIILVGFREWEDTDNRKICDLLEVYSNDEIIHIRSFTHFTFDHTSDTSSHDTHHTHDFIFSHHKDTHYDTPNDTHDIHYQHADYTDTHHTHTDYIHDI